MGLVQQTDRMAWLPVRAGQDHLQQFSRRPVIDSLAEMIWNGLDAEADLVDVAVETTIPEANGAELAVVTRIVITDNGHGITPEVASSAFPSLGDSWKKTLNGRTLNGKRALHGSHGRGRFHVYSLGHLAKWTSVSSAGDERLQVEISGEQSRIDGFLIADAVPTADPVGTTLEVAVEQGRPLAVLLREDVVDQLAARLAAHLLGNEDITVRFNGQRVDPQPLIEGEPLEVVLDGIAEGDLGGREPPQLTIVDWTAEMKSAPGILLCNESGIPLVEASHSAPSGTVRSTGYLRWSGWSEEGADLLLVQMQHPEIVDTAIRLLSEHVASRTESLTATIVATLKEEGTYPYTEASLDPVQDAERQMFDLVAVTARGPLRASTRQQRAMSTQLLKIALQERPESLDAILAEALALSHDEREELAELLRYSPLGSIVGAASEVARRTDLLLALRNFVYSPDVADEFREVDQLHPLVRDNVWMFGEEWNLSASEMGLTNVLRSVLGNDKALEADLVRDGGVLVLPEGKRGRVDLVLERGIYGPGDNHFRLVVELKRPSVHIGDAELSQVKGYARALADHNGAGKARWTFWIIGSEIKPEIEGELDQEDRAWGHVIKRSNYDVIVSTWGSVLDAAELRLHFYREQLNYNIGQGDAVERVRHRHAELLPEPEHGSAPQ